MSGGRVFEGALLLVSLACGAVVLLIVAFVFRESWPALGTVSPLRFFTDGAWRPAAGVDAGRFDLSPMLVGSLVVTSGAIGLAAPAGVGLALFSRFYAPPPLRSACRRLLEVMAGIPSVVYGFWGLVVLVPLVARWQPPGQSVLAAILVVAVMIVPTVALLTESSLRSVPRADLDAAAALGLTRLGTLRSAVLPTVKGGIATAVLLATCRAVGETMAVLMVAGNVVRMPDGPFAPVRTLTANIALELGYAMDHHRSALFVSGLALTALVVALVSAAEIIERVGRSRAHA